MTTRPSIAAPAGPTEARPAASGRLARWWSSGALRKLRIVAVLLVVWELAARGLNISPLIFPPASAVIAAWVRGMLSGEILAYAWQSLYLLLVGMLLATIISVVFVSLAVTTRVGRELLETLTSMFNPLPAVALLPLALLWFGLGTNSLVFVLIHSVLWPLSLNAYTGFVTVPPTLIRVGQNFGLRGWRLVLGILLPAAFPNLLTGLKIGWAFAWRTIIAAELVFGVAGSRGGLGWYIYRNRYDLNTPEVFAGLITIIVIGLLVETIVFQTVERKTVVRWGMQARGGGDRVGAMEG